MELLRRKVEEEHGQAHVLPRLETGRRRAEQEKSGWLGEGVPQRYWVRDLEQPLPRFVSSSTECFNDVLFAAHTKERKSNDSGEEEKREMLKEKSLEKVENVEVLPNSNTSFSRCEWETPSTLKKAGLALDRTHATR